MADHAAAPDPGQDVLGALTKDRENMWHTFTKATTAAAIFVALLLIAMAVFLL